MNSKAKAVISAIIAISLGSGGFAFGQGYGDRTDRGRNDRVQRGDHQDRRDRQWRPPPVRRDMPGRPMYDAGRLERGAGPSHEFRRGQRLPSQYRHRNYVVDDWRGHHLSAPPRGYHWVQVGPDYVLVAIATGIILQMLLNN